MKFSHFLSRGTLYVCESECSHSYSYIRRTHTKRSNSILQHSSYVQYDKYLTHFRHVLAAHASGTSTVVTILTCDKENFASYRIHTQRERERWTKKIHKQRAKKLEWCMKKKHTHCRVHFLCVYGKKMAHNCLALVCWMTFFLLLLLLLLYLFVSCEDLTFSLKVFIFHLFYSSEYRQYGKMLLLQTAGGIFVVVCVCCVCTVFFV